MTTRLTEDETHHHMRPDHLREVLAKAEECYRLRREGLEAIAAKDPDFDSEAAGQAMFKASMELGRLIHSDAEFAMLAVPALLRRGEMVKGADHAHGECPTWYDGCNCDVETLELNIGRADRAEDEALQLRQALATLTQACEDAVQDHPRLQEALQNARRALRWAKQEAERRDWRDSVRHVACPGCGAQLVGECNDAETRVWVECVSERCDWAGEPVVFKECNDALALEGMLAMRRRGRE